MSSTFPPLSISPLSVKREIALAPAMVFLTFANSSFFHFEVSLVASRMNSYFV